MSGKDLIEGVLIGLGGASGLWGVYQKYKLKRIRKHALLAMLDDPDHPEWKFRSLEQLSRAVGLSADATKELLLEIGARANRAATDPRELWTLGK